MMMMMSSRNGQHSSCLIQVPMRHVGLNGVRSASYLSLLRPCGASRTVLRTESVIIPQR